MLIARRAPGPRCGPKLEEVRHHLFELGVVTVDQGQLREVELDRTTAEKPVQTLYRVSSQLVHGHGLAVAAQSSGLDTTQTEQIGDQSV